MPPLLPFDTQLRQVATEVAGAVSARLVVLFGSVARAEVAPRDLDIGVLVDGPADAVALTNAFTTRLGIQHVDVADLRRADPVLLALVARDGVPLYERAPGEFARFASLATRRFADTEKFRRAQERLLPA